MTDNLSDKIDKILTALAANQFSRDKNDATFGSEILLLLLNHGTDILNAVMAVEARDNLPQPPEPWRYIGLAEGVLLWHPETGQTVEGIGNGKHAAALAAINKIKEGG